MKKLHCLNYYIHWVALLAVIIGLVGEIFVEESRIVFGRQDMILISLASYFYLYFYQFVCSVISVLKYKRNSLFLRHLGWMIVYMTVYALFNLYGFEALLDYIDSYTIPLTIILLPSLYFVIRYGYITYTQINPIKIYNNEKSQ